MYLPFNVEIGTTGTLVWRTTSETPPDPPVDYDNRIFPAGSPDGPRPIGIVLPSGANFYLVGEVGASYTDGVLLTPGPYTIPVNAVGSDQMVLATDSTPQQIGFFVGGL